MNQQQARFYLAQWREGREETRYFMAQVDTWMWRLFITITGLIGVSFLDQAVDQRLGYAVILASVLGATSPYILARYDLLMHRPAPMVKALENTLDVLGWENHFKPQMKTLTAFLAPLDFVMAVPLTLLFWFATQESAVILGQWYAHTAWGAYMLGWVVLVVGLIRAGKLMDRVHI